MKEEKTLQIGIIGAGGIGRHYINTFKKVTGAKVAAAADPNEKALTEVAKLDESIQRFGDYHKMLKALPLDGVVVGTPNKLHLQPTLDALAAGLPVIVEKPMAMNARDAERMCKAAEKAGKLIQIGFQQRFLPAAQMIRKAVEAGDLGKILYVRCQALRRRGIPSWGVFGRKDLQGGGPMIDIGVHVLEMAHCVMGKPAPVSATGACYTYLGNRKPEALSSGGPWDYKTYTVEDLAVGMIRFKTGATLVIESSFAAHIEKDVFNFQIMGEKGGATFEPPVLFKDAGGYMFNLSPAFVGTPDAFLYKIQHFVDCIRTGKPCEAPGTDGLVVQKMLDAIYKSAELGRTVSIR
jgi:predicted dehydrogenase